MSTRLRAAGTSLRVPPGHDAARLLDPEAAEAVGAFVESSPDHSIYHFAPYVEFERSEHQPADLIMLSRDGNPEFALPVQRRARAFVQTGYSGVLFPAAGREAPLRRAVAAFASFLDANPRLAFSVIQAAQSDAHDDPSRPTLLRRLFEEHDLEMEPIYTRMLDLPGLRPPPEDATAELAPDWLENELLRSYDGDARNQVRQALKRGVRVRWVLSSLDNAPDALYELMHPVQLESRTRTGMLPRPLSYWSGLSRTITAAGGRDLVVVALDAEGRPIAGATCHAHRGKGLYWSGCSNDAGLRLRANPLCLHAAISLAAAHGVRRFETGRFRVDEGSSKEIAIGRYKAQFGGRLERINSFIVRELIARRSLAVFHTRQRVIGSVYERVMRSRAAAARRATVGP